MNSQVSIVQNLLRQNKISESIDLVEHELKKQSLNHFHALIGRNDLLKQTKKLHKWMVKFFKSANKKIYVKSLCVEMNDIASNPESWYLDIFAYDNFGGDQNLDWLEEWQHENSDRHSFKIKGFEDIQKAFKTFGDKERTENKLPVSVNLVEMLVLLRLFELFDAAHSFALEKEGMWTNVPVIVRADGNELSYLLK